MKREITDLIKEIVKEETGVKELLKMTRKRQHVVARQIFFYLCKKYTKYGLSDIGELLNKDHATVIHSVKQVNKIIDTKDFYLKWLLSCEESLSEALKTTQVTGFIKLKPTSKEISYSETILHSKIKLLSSEIDRLRLELFVEKKKSQFKNEKYKDLEKYLNKIPMKELNHFYETRIIPYAKMCESKVTN